MDWLLGDKMDRWTELLNREFKEAGYSLTGRKDKCTAWREEWMVHFFYIH